MDSSCCFLLLLFCSCLLCVCPTASSEPSPFALVRDRLTEPARRDFSTGLCNASLPINDHLHQLVDWCRLHRNQTFPGCFSHGHAVCLFKKYIDTARSSSSGESMTGAELGRRLLIFRDNVINVAREIESRLKSSPGASERREGAARFGITKFMHLSPIEFRERYLTSLKPSNRTVGPRLADHQLLLRRRRRGSGTVAFSARPDRVDWRDKGVVTGVKNQGPCGACWAFAVVEVAESALAAKLGGRPTELSVQQVSDCVKCAVCAGCSGGDTCQAAAFYSTLTTNAIVEERLYPYVAKDAVCENVSGGVRMQTSGVRCESFVNREPALLDHLWQSGTAAVAVDAHLWQFYIDGVIMHNCETELNHAVQLVGYDMTKGPVPYYLARNSWGADWGVNGYLGIAQGANVCGLAINVVTFGAA